MTKTNRENMFSVPFPEDGKTFSGKKPESILREAFGYDQFREGQEDIIQNLIAGRDVFAILPTGRGKSLCYQVPALARHGISIVISPLIALMKDQVETLRKKGVRASALNSSMSEAEINETERLVREGAVSILYIAPERAITTKFRSLLRISPSPVGLIAIDEAHCVSQWGNDFRPSYLNLPLFIQEWPEAPKIALTASADPATADDIVDRLGMDGCARIVGGFDRPNISIEMRQRQNTKNDILEHIKRSPGESGIVFCPTRKQVEQLTDFLTLNGINAIAYHAAMPDVQRSENQDRFLKEEGVVAVATIAFGMGIDKANVRYVLHAELPTTVESYYQEIGRAGRDGLPSRAILFGSDADSANALRNIQRAMEDADDERRPYLRNRIIKVQEMQGIFESSQCRRKSILRAFGENYPGPCNNCDRCLRPQLTTDVTSNAKLVFKAIAATSQIYGANYIIDILHGIRNAKIAENEHDTIAVFGSCKDVSRKRLSSLIRQMRVDGYIKAEPESGGLSLDAEAWDVLRGDKKVTMSGMQPLKPNDPVIKTNIASLPDRLATALHRLLAMRSEIAESRSLLPEDVLSTKALEALISARPETLTELGLVPGIPPLVIEEYADDLLSLFQEREPSDIGQEFSLF